MAHNYTVARPYARAVFMQAKEDHQFSEWQTVLQKFAAIVCDPTISHMLNDPRILAERWIDLFLEIAFEQAPSFSDAFKQKVKNFIQLISERKRYQLLPDIAQEFQTFVLQDQKVLNVEVLSAFPLEAEQKNAMQSSLERRFKLKTEIDYKIDHSLIGGAVIRAGNWVLDGSVRSKLERLTECLK
jgi:F-type H+-transporting ATPase subunit delta